jgi:phage terminase large subunit-like protein
MTTKNRTVSAGNRAPAQAKGDFTDRATAYAQAAVADKRGLRTCKFIRQACKRFLDDLKRAAKPRNAFLFSRDHANHVCEFVEMLPHVEGKWDHPDIVLHDSQCWFLVNLFGFRRRSDGMRRFTHALYAVARKNAKSTLSAAILLYCFCHEDETGAQVMTAATTYNQAAIIFKMAKAMVDKTTDLREAFGLQSWAKAISRMEIGGSFKAIHAKAMTQDGLNPSHVGLDEIHAHKNSDLVNVLQSAQGARASPLWLYTTTEGYENPGPWAPMRKFARDLLDQVIPPADHFLVAYYAIDDADEPMDPKVWIKANPLWDVNPYLRDAITKEANMAKVMPSSMGEFLIKRVNRPAAAAQAWVDLNRWRKCDGRVDLDWLEGKPCTAGMDLASTGDLTAYRLVWNVDGVLYTYGHRWVPANAVAQRTASGTTLYEPWVAAGLITKTDGDVIDYAVVERDIMALNQRFRPSRVGYDTWNSSDIVNRMTDPDKAIDGVEFVQFIQGPKSYQPAVQALEIAYGGGKLAHGGDPVLRWNAANVIMKTDDNLNKSPSKKRSAEKIDDMCALLMAIGVGLTDDTTVTPDYSAWAAESQAA